MIGGNKDGGKGLWCQVSPSFLQDVELELIWTLNEIEIVMCNFYNLLIII